MATHRRHDVDDTSLRRRMFLAWRDLRVARGRFVLVGVVIGLVALLRWI